MLVVKNDNKVIEPGGVFALGNFDGVHLGHKEIIEIAKETSIKNCQILMNDKLVFEMGKLSKNKHSIYFKNPFSILQAFFMSSIIFAGASQIAFAKLYLFVSPFLSPQLRHQIQFYSDDKMFYSFYKQLNLQNYILPVPVTI